MLRIAHTADVHIRALSRHDEYRQILEAFVEDCRAQRVDHIFVGGDIFHTKTLGISPEYIEFLTWWLKEMSAVATVHLTLGNHDGNLVNLSRQDAVSPVVAALNDDRIKLYKKSGTYEFHPGFAWCVYSLFDEEGWKDVSQIPGFVNIACYHGPVYGSKTEAGWELDDGLKLDFFQQHKYAFLGDIHKRQHLAFRNDKNGNPKPWISYPGTPIQQNYAEELEHGYLLWTIDNNEEWDVHFRKLPNLKPYVTLQWNGATKDLVEEAAHHPDGARYRVKSNESLGQKEFAEISSLLKSHKAASEVTFKSDVIVDRTTVKAGSATLQKSDLRNPDVILKLTKDYHANSQVSIEDWEAIDDQVKSYLTAITSSEESVRNSKWSLRYLSFDNMFSYGAKNVVHFEKLNGIVGIFGQNRVGKSSIVGTIMYSLFNTTDRGSIKNLHVCNVRKPYCSSKAIINHNGLDYVIERQTTKSENRRGVVSASTSLNFFRIRPDGEADDLSGEQRTDTEKVVRNLIGSNEDFFMTSLSAQGETGQFISQGSTKRRAILSRFLDLDVFDKMYELANRDLGSLKARLKSYSDKDWDTTSSVIEKDLQEVESQLVSLAGQAKEKQERLSESQLELSKHKDFSPVTLAQIASARSEVSTIEKKLEECLSSIDKLQESIAESSAKLETIGGLRAENDLSELKAKKDLYKKLQNSLLALAHVHEKEVTVLNQHKRSLKILDEVPCADDYPTCKFIKDAHANKSKLSDQEEKVRIAQGHLQDASFALEKMDGEDLTKRLDKMERLIELESKLKLEASKKEIEIAKLNAAKEAKQVDLDVAKKRLVSLEEAYKNEENSEVAFIRSNISEITKALDALLAQKLDLATKRGRLSATLEKLNEEKVLRDATLKQMRVSELIVSAFSRKGVPLIVTNSQLPVINAEIAKVLQGIVDFTVELENDEATDSSEIYINYGDSRRIIELCSGMEKTIASLAIRVAMINVTSLPKSDMFIIDEGFGTLDDASVEACNRLLVALKRYFKTIVVITHVDGVKDVADHLLEITKDEKDSRVRFGEDHE